MKAWKYNLMTVLICLAITMPLCAGAGLLLGWLELQSLGYLVGGVIGIVSWLIVLGKRGLNGR